ncbi:MAG: MFS transporter [Nitrospirae bacterium]|nr:MAG: MFS transporter [Nitrospirota bacterium]
MTAAPSSSVASLLRGLLISQFCGAFNDNAWKLIVALLAIKEVATKFGTTGPEFEMASQTQTTLAFVIFTLPLMFLSLIAGVFADRYSKRQVIIVMKWIEVGLMTLGTVALWHNPSGSVPALLVLAGMGAQSALFSPAKYGILPELLPHDRLSEGNGLLELWTFAAIILGTAAGGVLLGLTEPTPWLAGLVLTLLTLLGLWAAYRIPPVRAARTEGGTALTIWIAWNAIRDDRMLRFAIVGAIIFWTVASLVGQDIIIYGKAVLHLTDTLTGLPLAAFAIGIGIGSILAGKISGPKVEYGLIPFGAMGIGLLLCLLGVHQPSLRGTLFLMSVLGLASGFVVVPINALIQWRSPDDRRGAVIALNNTAVFSGVLVGSLGAGGLANLGLSATEILIFAGATILMAFIATVRLMPDALLRSILLLLTNTLYRLQVMGREHVPVKGGALMVAWNVSVIDGLLIQASLDRPVTFVGETAVLESHPVLRWILGHMRILSLSSAHTAEARATVWQEARHRLEAGDLVCLIAEGERVGQEFPLSQIIQRILPSPCVPLVPIYLDRLWGNIFRCVQGRFSLKWPPAIPYPLAVVFGAPRSAESSPEQLQQTIQELGEIAWRNAKSTRPLLHHAVVRSLRRHLLRLMFADLTRPRVSGLQALIGAIVLARALRLLWRDQRTVGILLPPSVGGALTNLAATLVGRIAVNLNYTIGQSGMEAIVRQAGLRTIVSSRDFVRKAQIAPPQSAAVIWLEDLRASIGIRDKVVALVLALLASPRSIERACGSDTPPSIDDLATIIFSSGTTGEPKGVMLSHFNLVSNLEGIAQILHVDKRDRMLGILPFFHSFGYLTTLWFAAIHGVGVVYHPSPLDAGPIGSLIERYKVTILLATPTFLQLYFRRWTPEQCRSLRVVITGAEKLPDRLAHAFEARFGVRPVEGYGVTECAPVVSVNCPDHQAAGLNHPAFRAGSVGRPLPGVSVRIVEPETFAPLPVGMSGMLLVKGPNVMNGYLGRPDLTAEAMHGQWYITGDIAKLDEEGFITITDRLARFAKIGGEMVPHALVEDALQKAAGADTQILAVTSIPDQKKGEQLVVFHTCEESMIATILERAVANGVPPLFLPRRDRFLKIEQLPILGTGKLNLQALKRLAIERFGLNDQARTP